MSILEAIVLGVVQGLTEFLPVSSTAHLRIVPALLGWNDPGAAYSAVLQTGTLAAVCLALRHDIAALLGGCLAAVRSGRPCGTPESRLSLLIVLGTVPIVAAGLAFKDLIRGEARRLDVVTAALVAATALMAIAELASLRSITDKPRFGWRGLMLDVSRHFFTKTEVKEYIDNMVLHKYNVLHLHLTDDQGWRIEIKALPKLTEVGAWRVDRKGKWGNITTPSLDEPKTYGGFYTHEDIKELVAYAKSKFVEILPEIDIPGHSMAFLASYPLSTTPNYNYQVNAGTEFMDWTGYNGHATAKIDNALNPANETVYNYLDKIFTEVASLFPFEYIHMGGDETAKNNWEKSTDVENLMKRENLKDQNEVQSYFVKRVEKIINAKGKKLMGWDEILEGGLPGNAAVMSWRGMLGGIEAANQKHQVVMTPNDFAYIDFYQGEVTAEGKVYKGLRMKKTYEFEPLPQGIDPKYILGGQANLWTEQILSLRSAQYLTWPRSMSIAETLWSPKEKKNWQNFSEKVEKQFEILDALNIKHAKSMYDPIVTTTTNTKGELIAKMEGEVDNLKFYYSIDESLPDNFSTEYTGTFIVPNDATILRVISYRNGKPIGKMLHIPMESLISRAVKTL